MKLLAWRERPGRSIQPTARRGNGDGGKGTSIRTGCYAICFRFRRPRSTAPTHLPWGKRSALLPDCMQTGPVGAPVPRAALPARRESLLIRGRTTICRLAARGERPQSLFPASLRPPQSGIGMTSLRRPAPTGAFVDQRVDPRHQGIVERGVDKVPRTGRHHHPRRFPTIARRTRHRCNDRDGRHKLWVDRFRPWNSFRTAVSLTTTRGARRTSAHAAFSDLVGQSMPASPRGPHRQGPSVSTDRRSVQSAWTTTRRRKIVVRTSEPVTPLLTRKRAEP